MSRPWRTVLVVAGVGLVAALAAADALRRVEPPPPAAAGSRSEPAATEPRAELFTAQRCVSGVRDATARGGACATAWLRQVLAEAGLPVAGATRGAWIVRDGSGQHFGVTTTRARRTLHRILSAHRYRLAAKVDGVSVFAAGDRYLWRTSGSFFWIAAGPIGDSAAPVSDDVERLVRASGRVPAPPW